MSKQIENNVVQMTFDNKDFEKNISTSTKSIEKLNEELKFKDASEGFKDLEKYANNVNFDGLNKAIGNINSVFTVTGALSKKIIDDIAGYFEEKIVGTVSKVKNTISYIVDPNLGVQKYEEFNTVLKSMQANLAEIDRQKIEQLKKDGFLSKDKADLEYINMYMEKLLEFTDETSYSFTDMANTLAKFTSNNVGLEEATQAVQGIALAAAVAGQNAGTANQAMYQLAQSFSTGYLKYQDWAQAFGTKNIATSDLKKAFIDAALEAGTLSNDDIEEAKRQMKGNWMSYFYTSDALSQEWLQVETVLVRGLEKYNSASQVIFKAINDWGAKAGINVSNITEWGRQLLKITDRNEATIKKFVADLGYEGDTLKNLEELFLTVGDAEHELGLKALVAGQQATNFHEAIDAVRDAFGTNFMKVLTYFIGDVDQASGLWTDFSNALWDTLVGPIAAAQDGFEAWNLGITGTNEESQKLAHTYETFWSSVGGIFSGIGSVVNGFFDQIRFVAGAFSEAENGTREAGSIIEKYTLRALTRVTITVERLSEAISGFLETDLYKNLVNSFGNVVKIINNVRKITDKVFSATIGTLLKNLDAPLTAISNIILQITDRLLELTEKVLKSKTFNDILAIVSKLVTKVTQLAAVIINKFGEKFFKIVDKVAELASDLLDLILPGLEAVIDFVDKYVLPAIDDLIEGPYSIGAGVDWLWDLLTKDAIPAIETFLEDVTGMNFSDAKNAIKDFADDFIGHVKRLSTEGFDIIKDFVKDTFNADTKGSIPEVFKIISEADSAAEGATEVVRWSGDALSRPVKLIFDLVGLLVGKDLSSMATAVTDFIKSVADALADLTPDLFKGVEWVVDTLVSLLKEVAGIVSGTIKYISGKEDTTGYKTLDAVLQVIKNFVTAIFELFVGLLKTLTELLKYLTPAALSALEWVKGFAKNLVEWVKDMFKTFAEVKDPEEFADRVFLMLKIALALLIFIKIGEIIMSVSYFFGGIGRSTNLFAKGFYAFGDMFASIGDLLGGYNMSGKLLWISVMLLSFGKALQRLIEAANAFKDPETVKGAAIAMLMMLVLIRFMFKIIGNMFNAQSKGYEEIYDAVKRKDKAKKKLDAIKRKNLSKGSNDFLGLDDFADIYDNDTNSMVSLYQARSRTLLGIGTCLLGMAAALIAVSYSVNKLASAADQFGTKKLLAAAVAVAGIMLAMGIFIKLVSGWNNTTTDTNLINTLTTSNSNRKSVFSNYSSKTAEKEINSTVRSFKGIASSLMGLAMAITIISIPMWAMAKTANSTGLGAFWSAAGAIVGIIAVMGFMVALAAKWNKQTITQSAGLIFVLNAIKGMIVALGLVVVGLALVMSKVITGAGAEQIRKDIVTMTAIFAGVMAFVTLMVALMMRTGKNMDMSVALKKLGMQLAKIVLASVVIQSLAIAVVLITGSIMFLAKEFNKNRSSDIKNDTMIDIINAIVLITAIITVLGLFIVLISKFIGKGATEEQAKKMAGVSAMLLGITVFFVSIVKMVIILATYINGFDELNGRGGSSVIEAVEAIGKIMIVLALFIGGIALISKLLSGGGIGGSESGGTALLKLAGGIVAISVALAALSGVLIGLAAAFTFFKDGQLGKALLLCAGALGVLVAAVAAMALISKLAGPALKGLAFSFGFLALAILGTMLAVFIFVTAGEALSAWLEKKMPTIEGDFKRIGEAMTLVLIGLAKGINEHLPELLTELNKLIVTILEWIKENIGTWVELAANILIDAIKALCFTVYERREDLAEAIGVLIAGIIEILCGALYHAWDKVTEDLSELLWKCSDEYEEFRRREVQREADLQNDLYNLRLKGFEKAMSLMAMMENYDEGVRLAKEKLAKADRGEIFLNTAERAYLYNQINSADQQIKEAEEWLSDELHQKKYDFHYDVGRGVEEQRKENAEKGFDSEDVWAKKYKQGMYSTGQQGGKALGDGTIDGLKDTTGTNSPAKILSWIGKMCNLGFIQGLLGKGGENGEEIGSEYGGGILSGLTSSLSGSDIASDAMSGIDLNSLNEDGALAGISFGDGMIDGFETSMGDMDWSTSANLPSYNMEKLGNYDDLMNLDGGTIGYTGQLDTTVSDRSLKQATDVIQTSDNELLKEFKAVRDELKEYTFAISNIQMYLDTGILVGEMKVPMDKALGRMADRKERRGI